MLSWFKIWKKGSGDKIAYIEISVILKFMERPKTPGIIFRKYGIARRESISCWWFLCCFKEIQRNGTGKNRLSNITDTLATNASSGPKYVLLQGSSLKSKTCSEKNIKTKYLMSQASITLSCKFELKLTKPKDLFNLKYRKISYVKDDCS